MQMFPFTRSCGQSQSDSLSNIPTDEGGNPTRWRE